MFWERRSGLYSEYIFSPFLKMKTDQLLKKANQIKTAIGWAALSCSIALMNGGAAFADQSAEGTANTVITSLVIPLLRIIAIPAGVIYIITGAVKYAQSHAEGEGPAMHKAINQIVAGIAIVAIAAILSSLPWNVLLTGMGDAA